MYNLDEIKRHTEEYLSEIGIELKNNQFRCPFHDDKHASATYYPNDNHMHCYVCSKTFDVISLYAEMNNRSQGDAMKELANKYNIQEQVNPVFKNNQSYSKAKAPAQNKAESEEQKDYSNQFEAWNKILNTKYSNGIRGISIETLNRFNFGYVMNYQYQYRDKTTNETKYFNTQKNYFVMPNSKYSFNTRVDDSNEKDLKCLKTGTQIPFNIESLKDNKPCFIVEGEFDALSIIECGYNAIAVSGQPTETFYERVKEMNKTSVLIISLDMDKENIIKNASECLSRLKELGANAYIPEQNEDQTLKMYLGTKDANEAYLKDREAFKAELDKAVSYYEQMRIEDRDKYIESFSNQYTSIGFIDRMRTIQRDVIPTGFVNLDKKLDGGLYAGLYVLGGVTGTGKTTFAMQIANNIARNNDIDVMTIALEMGKQELIARDISRLTYSLSKNEKYSTIARYILNPNKDYEMPAKQRETLYLAEQTYSAFANHLYTIEGAGDIKADDIRKYVNDHKSKLGKAPILIVDYLQILAPTNDKQSDKWNIDKSMLELKRISRDYNIPVIAISSLNRDSYKTKNNETDKAISLASFKESGSIEYGSDVVIALDKNSDDEICRDNMRLIDVNILKNRNGSTGKASKIVFHTWFNYMEETD